jgi:hypothetical protein
MLVVTGADLGKAGGSHGLPALLSVSRFFPVRTPDRLPPRKGIGVTDAMIAATVQSAERMMKKIDNVCAG